MVPPTTTLRPPRPEASSDALNVNWAGVGHASLPARVLLAEDDPEMLEVLASVLWSDGYQVIEAQNGDELLHLLEPYMPSVHRYGRLLGYDLIVSDIRMPGLTAFDVLTALRRYDSSTPVILVTAFPDDETKALADSCRVSALLSKPFDLDDFRACVWKVVPPR